MSDDPVSGDPLPPLRNVIARHGLSARKSLGQNFLLDLNLTRRIARAAAPLAGHTIVEVGPGPGGLTRALLMEGAERVVAVERDARVLPALAEVAAAFPGRLEVVEADALGADWRALVGDRPAKIVANLPYNIATPLLVGWLTAEPWPPWYRSLTLMFQSEVADRIAAAPGTKVYGRLSVIAQARTRARALFDIDRRAFTPPPKITSTLVEIVPLEVPPEACPIAALEKVTASAFGQRRKMLRASLKTLLPDPEPLLAEAGIAPTARAEELTVAQFCRLAQLYAAG
ncbi:MAG TPA: 16S rRNA (adenine(1518)-N(6)/adenine(1519)-N(6))-dimethyltransferase RsmA [Aestuariivirgaceae bacterium]|nr:16S rRNA (adenine(1518)-N(6)/adenine(1519)-N(6))-dimethyltransferase RsmA [Aestuariivirgaceae bacterium]